MQILRGICIGVQQTATYREFNYIEARLQCGLTAYDFVRSIEYNVLASHIQYTSSLPKKVFEMLLTLTSEDLRLRFTKNDIQPGKVEQLLSWSEVLANLQPMRTWNLHSVE